jgi:hypothetical protein
MDSRLNTTVRVDELRTFDEAAECGTAAVVELSHE